MKNKSIILAAIALVVVVAAMLAAFFLTRPSAPVPEDGTQAAGKTFTVIVIHGNETQKDFTYTTDANKLGAFLEENGLIDSTGADVGMFHTVDGEKADWNENRSYWALYEGDTYANQGIYDTLITDGAVFKLVYTVG